MIFRVKIDIKTKGKDNSAQKEIMFLLFGSGHREI